VYIYKQRKNNENESILSTLTRNIYNLWLELFTDRSKMILLNGVQG